MSIVQPSLMIDEPALIVLAVRLPMNRQAQSRSAVGGSSLVDHLLQVAADLLVVEGNGVV